MPFSLEVRVQAVRWKLGLPTTHDAAQLQAAWAEIARDRAAVRALTVALSQPMYRALAAKLGGETNPKYEWASGLAVAFTDWLEANESVASAKLSGLLSEVLRPPVAVALARPVKPTGLHPDAGRPRRPPTPPVPEMPPPLPTTPPPPLPASLPPAPPVGWQCKPVPATPEPYPESVALALADAPAGFRGFGANVRGKKHKHDGTNCDDAFAFGRAGDWTVVAVADGAGSKKLSRLGARAAVAAAVATLTDGLTAHAVTDRTTSAEWLAALAPAGDGFAAADVQAVAASLHAATRAALEALTRVTAELQGRDDLTAFLHRPAEVADLSCTLLLAVTRAVVADGKPLHLVVGCQVGDGLIGTVSRAGSVTQVGTADSGGHAGETDFLTSGGKTEPAFLAKKTAAALTDLQALLVMTDGVADDYFPAPDHLPRLWGDLVVNGVPDLDAPTPDAVANALSGTALTAEAAAGFEYGVGTEVVEPDPRRTVYLRSCETFAQRLGTTAAELIKRPATLWAGRKPVAGETAEARLKLWLDTYQVRGSFDDRTLVVLHREALS